MPIGEVFSLTNAEFYSRPRYKQMIRVTIKGAIAVALISLTTACANFPLLGRNRAANQVEPAPEGTLIQPANQAPLRTGQPATQAQTGTQTTAQAPQTTQGQGGTGTGDIEPVPVAPAPADTNEPIPALW